MEPPSPHTLAVWTAVFYSFCLLSAVCFGPLTLAFTVRRTRQKKKHMGAFGAVHAGTHFPDTGCFNSFSLFFQRSDFVQLGYVQSTMKPSSFNLHVCVQGVF